MARFRDRPTTDILILMIAGTICVSVLAAGATVAIAKIFAPDTDVGIATNIISDTINTLIGLLAGFLAGRTDATQQQIREAHLREAERERAEIEREVKAQRAMRIESQTEDGEESP
jgi:hypothetical protein